MLFALSSSFRSCSLAPSDRPRKVDGEPPSRCDTSELLCDSGEELSRFLGRDDDDNGGNALSFSSMAFQMVLLSSFPNCTRRERLSTVASICCGFELTDAAAIDCKPTTTGMVRQSIVPISHHGNLFLAEVFVRRTAAKADAGRPVGASSLIMVEADKAARSELQFCGRLRFLDSL